MDKIGLQIKQEENTIIDIAQKSQMASLTYMATKHELLQHSAAKGVVKSKVLNTAGAMFIQYEKEPDKSNQIMKSYQRYIADDNNKNDVLKKVFEISTKATMTSEKDIVYKNKCINRFIEF